MPVRCREPRPGSAGPRRPRKRELLRLAKYSVGQVGNLRRGGNPPADDCRWSASAGCQPARRMPSCPTKPSPSWQRPPHGAFVFVDRLALVVVFRFLQAPPLRDGLRGFVRLEAPEERLLA